MAKRGKGRRKDLVEKRASRGEVTRNTTKRRKRSSWPTTEIRREKKLIKTSKARKVKKQVTMTLVLTTMGRRLTNMGMRLESIYAASDLSSAHCSSSYRMTFFRIIPDAKIPCGIAR